MIDQNIVIIILLCITFIILFQGITYLFETYTETFTEYESPSMSPSSITKEIIVGEVYPKSNMIDASNMRIRLDRLTEIFNKNVIIDNDVINTINKCALRPDQNYIRKYIKYVNII